MGEETTLEKLFKSMDKDGDGTVTKEVDDCSHICSRSFSYLFKIVLMFVQDRSHICPRSFSYLFKIVLIFVQDHSHIYAKSFSSGACSEVFSHMEKKLLPIITDKLPMFHQIINIMILPGVPEDLQEFDSRPSNDN